MSTKVYPVASNSVTLESWAARQDSSILDGYNLQKLASLFNNRLTMFFLLAVTLLGASASAKAETFEGIKPLVFTKAYEGANPLPQVFTVASADSNFEFRASVVSGSGGDWLTITRPYYGGQSYNITPAVIKATVQPDVTLAAGTYTAQIVLKSTDGTVTQTVSVSLIVKATSTAFFDALPGALTFSMLTKNTVIPTQTVQIRNAGAGTLSFTASDTTYNSGGWIILSATSGTAPYLLNIGINVSKLPGKGLTAGTFTGQVVLQTSGDTVTIPVSVTVGDSVFRQINPLNFSKVYEGSNPLPQVFTVASTGTNLIFSVTAVSGTGGDWLTITRPYYGGQSYNSTPAAIKATVNPDITLAAGTYTAQINVTSTDGTESNVIPVTLTVAPATSSSFDELPGELTFSMVTKGTAPPPQIVPIRNAGDGTLNFTASSSTADGSSWIILSATSGTAPYMLKVGIDPSRLPGEGLTAGTFTGQVVLQTSGDTVTIPVSVTVGDSVFRQINPLNFSKVYEGADPLPQVFTVASTGSNFTFSVTAVSGTGGDWLTITRPYYGGQSYNSTPAAIKATVNPDITLAAGTYTAQINVTSTDGTESNVIPVTLTVAPTTASSFDELPGELTFSMMTKGTAPPPQVVPIRNAGDGTLNFTASSSTADGSSWIILSATSGTAPYLLNVGINVSKLPGEGLTGGTFAGQVVLQTSGDTVTIPVTVTVGDSVFRQVNPLSFSKVYKGANPLPQVFTVASTGANLIFSVTAISGTGGDWLTISRPYYGGQSYNSTPAAIKATVNPDITLAAGTYTAQINVTSTDGTESNVIPVTLTVAPTTASSFDELPSALTFLGQANGKSLASQPLAIRDAGPGTLNWVATATTADSGGWLTLSAASGTAPFAPTVSVDVSKLPGKGLTAGSFTGQVVLQSAVGMATVPVTVTLADSVFVPVAALSFSKPYQGANPSTQMLTISSTDTNFNFYTSAVAGTGGNWLTVKLPYYGGQSYNVTPSIITVTANPDVNLAAGVYTSEIIITSTDGTEPLIVPVTLTITNSAATGTPKFSPAGGSYSTTQNVTITTSTTDSAIYYTTDGSTPTTSSLRFTGPIQVAATETIKAIAIAPGRPQSAVGTAAYTITSPQAATPGATITIAEATAGVTVYYTTNGSTPTTSSIKYTGPITLSSGSVLKFIAIGPDYTSSAVRTVSTTIQ